MENGSRKKALVIVNQNSGTGSVRRLCKQREAGCGFYDFKWIGEIESFSSFIKENLCNYDVFVAAGGDGTVNSLAAELAGTDKILAVLPYGSGNGYAREMGFTRDLKELRLNIEKGDFLNTDVLKVNGHWCVNIAGTGIDSQVAHSFHYMETRGLFSYILTTMNIIARIKPVEATVAGKGFSYSGKWFLVSAANTRQFGNNALVAPSARPDDGFLDIVLLKPFHGLLFPLFGILMMSGKLKESRYLKYIRTNEPVTVTSTEKRYHVDGEPLLIESPVTVEIFPGVLRVLKTQRTRKGR